MSIDEVSAAIGELKAEANASRNQRSELFSEVGDIKEMIGDLTVIVKTSITADEGRLTRVEEDVKSHGKSLAVLTTFKNRMLIGIAAIGGTGGIVGAITTGIASKIGLG